MTIDESLLTLDDIDTPMAVSLASFSNARYFRATEDREDLLMLSCEHLTLAREALVVGWMGEVWHEHMDRDWQEDATRDFIRHRTGLDWKRDLGGLIVHEYVKRLNAAIAEAASLVGLPEIEFGAA